MKKRATTLGDLQNICRNRRRLERDPGITRFVSRVEDDALRMRKKLGALIELWIEVLPRELVEQTRLVALRRGVLHVEADNASVRFEVDRALREGAEAELRSRFRGTLRGVRVVLG